MYSQSRQKSSYSTTQKKELSEEEIQEREQNQKKVLDLMLTSNRPVSLQEVAQHLNMDESKVNSALYGLKKRGKLHVSENKMWSTWKVLSQTNPEEARKGQMKFEIYDLLQGATRPVTAEEIAKLLEVSTSDVNSALWSHKYSGSIFMEKGSPPKWMSWNLYKELKGKSNVSPFGTPTSENMEAEQKNQYIVAITEKLPELSLQQLEEIFAKLG